MQAKQAVRDATDKAATDKAAADNAVRDEAEQKKRDGLALITVTTKSECTTQADSDRTTEIEVKPWQTVMGSVREALAREYFGVTSAVNYQLVSSMQDRKQWHFEVRYEKEGRAQGVHENSTWEGEGELSMLACYFPQRRLIGSSLIPGCRYREQRHGVGEALCHLKTTSGAALSYLSRVARLVRRYLICFTLCGCSLYFAFMELFFVDPLELFFFGALLLGPFFCGTQPLCSFTLQGWLLACPLFDVFSVLLFPLFWY